MMRQPAMGRPDTSTHGWYDSLFGRTSVDQSTSQERGTPVMSYLRIWSMAMAKVGGLRRPTAQKREEEGGMGRNTCRRVE